MRNKCHATEMKQNIYGLCQPKQFIHLVLQHYSLLSPYLSHLSTKSTVTYYKENQIVNI